MTTANGPACDRCLELLPPEGGAASFWFSHLRFCSQTCADNEIIDRLIKSRKKDLTIKKYGTRYWGVYDGNGDLVCVTLYKKGAKEVVRRITGK